MRMQRVRVFATLCHSSLMVLSSRRPRSSAHTHLLNQYYQVDIDQQISI